MATVRQDQAYLPRIAAIATAVPPHVFRQTDIEHYARQVFGGEPGKFERMRPIYANAGIETRYSCVDIDWHLRPHSWPERNGMYIECATDLLQQAAEQCLQAAERNPEDIDGLAIISTTGIATPSLDAQLMERLPFRRDIQRLPIFGLGCAGGVIGLARAAAMAKAAPGSRWLVLVVELCGLTFRKQDMSKSNIVASALFGDGAAAVLFDGDGDGPEFVASGEHTWPGSLDVMGWHMREDGFGVLFRRDIPDLVRTKMRGVADRFLDTNGTTLNDIDHFVLHPGGVKVVNALRDCFCLDEAQLEHIRGVLRDYGNMSAATVLFVLERSLQTGASGRTLLSALGPGFSAGFALLDSAPK